MAQTTPLADVDGQPAPPTFKVFGVGLSRTGTMSLRSALEILGFGPCHHPMGEGCITPWDKFTKAATDGATPEMVADIYSGYVSAVDSTTAIIAESLYKAYPDAKFILTTRDPEKWARSMRQTVLQLFQQLTQIDIKIESGTATEAERGFSESLHKSGFVAWFEAFINGYHRGRLDSDAENELLRHDEFIKRLIPPENLLVFDLAQGWEPLADFLGVPVPKEPFPHTNDTFQFNERLKRTGV